MKCHLKRHFPLYKFEIKFPILLLLSSSSKISNKSFSFYSRICSIYPLSYHTQKYKTHNPNLTWFLFTSLFVWIFILSTTMPITKRTSINPSSTDELSVPPDHLGRSSSNPRRPMQGIGPFRIRELPKRISPEISSLSEEGRSSERVDEIEMDSNMDPGTSMVYWWEWR